MSTEYLNNKAFETIIIKFQQAKRNKQKYKLLKKDYDIQKAKTTSQFSTIKNPLQLTDNEISNADVEYMEAQSILAEAFYTLSQNIVRYAKFSNIDEDDAIQEGVLICFERAEKFDPEKGKAFNYLTTCILNHFRQLWRTAKNYNELKKKYNEIFQIKLGLNVNARKLNKKGSKNNRDR
jgi:hypothetical protein